MENYRELQKQLQRINREVFKLQQKLANCNGEAYRGCWLDQSSDRTGLHKYTRLRWFIGETAKQKGCRSLQPIEVAEASKAIALWAELEQWQQQQRQVEAELQEVEAIATQLGLKLPKRKSADS
jgi:hypothetical protein